MAALCLVFPIRKIGILAQGESWRSMGGLMSSALGTGPGTQLVLKSQGCCHHGTGLACTQELPPGIRQGCTQIQKAQEGTGMEPSGVCGVTWTESHTGPLWPVSAVSLTAGVGMSFTQGWGLVRLAPWEE